MKIYLEKYYIFFSCIWLLTKITFYNIQCLFNIHTFTLYNTFLQLYIHKYTFIYILYNLENWRGYMKRTSGSHWTRMSKFHTWYLISMQKTTLSSNQKFLRPLAFIFHLLIYLFVAVLWMCWKMLHNLSLKYDFFLFFIRKCTKPKISCQIW